MTRVVNDLVDIIQTFSSGDVDVVQSEFCVNLHTHSYQGSCGKQGPSTMKFAPELGGGIQGELQFFLNNHQGVSMYCIHIHLVVFT